jgi:hypothetical protein
MDAAAVAWNQVGPHWVAILIPQRLILDAAHSDRDTFDCREWQSLRHAAVAPVTARASDYLRCCDRCRFRILASSNNRRFV